MRPPQEFELLDIFALLLHSRKECRDPYGGYSSMIAVGEAVGRRGVSEGVVCVCVCVCV